MALTLLLAGCRATPPHAAVPLPVAGESPPAQRAFRPLADAWRVATPEQRVQLQDPLRDFLRRHPQDDQARLARAYLAWIYVQTGALYEARQLIEATKRGPDGAASDFAIVAEAALLVEHNRPQEAITALRPLHGKIVDSTERFLATETLVRAALAAELYSEALLHAVDWLAQADAATRPGLRESVRSHLRHIPRRYLERALETMEPGVDDARRETDPAWVAQQQWLYDAISARLAAIALAQNDARLAQRVLDQNPAVLALNEQSAQLVRLASGGQTPAHVSGRTVGLLLNLTDPLARRRSSEVAAGLLLGLNAEALGEQAYRLVLAENHGTPANGLAELASQGAALIVGGVSEHEALEVARYAQRAQLPALLLQPSEWPTPFAFDIGVSDQQQLLAMNRGLKESWLPGHVLLEHDCARTTTAEARFPLTRWRQEGVRSLFIFAGDVCTRDLLSTLRGTGGSRAPWRYVLGLEAAHLWKQIPARRGRTLRAGHFPLDPDVEPEAARWAARLGHQPMWHETLGRDVALIARSILDRLPALRSDERAQVQAHHRAIRDALSRFQSKELWSSTDARFEQQTLTRTLSLSEP